MWEPGSELVWEPGSELVWEPGLELVWEPGSELVWEPGSELVWETGSELVWELRSELVWEPGLEVVWEPGSEPELLRRGRRGHLYTGVACGRAVPSGGQEQFASARLVLCDPGAALPRQFFELEFLVFLAGHRGGRRSRSLGGFGDIRTAVACGRAVAVEQFLMGAENFPHRRNIRNVGRSGTGRL